MSAAIREFDGANAKGQPITLTAQPMGRDRRSDRGPGFPAATSSRSLFDRIRDGNNGNDSGSDVGRDRRRRLRSASPNRNENWAGPGLRYGSDRESERRRRPELGEAGLAKIDRYVPGDRDGSGPPRRRRASPFRGGGDGDGYGDRDRRERTQGRRGGPGEGGRPRDARPMPRGGPDRRPADASQRRNENGNRNRKKTAEELDAEMDGYFQPDGGSRSGPAAGADAGDQARMGTGTNVAAGVTGSSTTVPGVTGGSSAVVNDLEPVEAPRLQDDGDVDMII